MSSSYPQFVKLSAVKVYGQPSAVVTVRDAA